MAQDREPINTMPNPMNESNAGERKPITHELKTWPEYFQFVFEESKRFELRKNNRDYRLGDTLHLREWNPETEQYTGREVFKRITYIFNGGKMGVRPEYVIISVTNEAALSPQSNEGTK
jgi:uncharacterized protein DUF3850